MAGTRDVHGQQAPISKRPHPAKTLEGASAKPAYLQCTADYAPLKTAPFGQVRGSSVSEGERQITADRAPLGKTPNKTVGSVGSSMTSQRATQQPKV